MLRHVLDRGRLPLAMLQHIFAVEVKCQGVVTRCLDCDRGNRTADFELFAKIDCLHIFRFIVQPDPGWSGNSRKTWLLRWGLIIGDARQRKKQREPNCGEWSKHSEAPIEVVNINCLELY